MKYENKDEKVFMKSSKRTYLTAVFFSLVMFTRAMGFLPYVPNIIIYICLGLSFLYGLSNKVSSDKLFIALLAYIPVEILLASPPSLFRSYPRFILFALLCFAIGPVFQSVKIRKWRENLLDSSLWICTLLAVGSFVCYFLGINYMRVNDEFLEIQSGTFGGLTNQSMVLGPIAGMTAIFMGYKAYLTKNKYYWIAVVVCMGAVLFSASRSSLVCSVTGLVMMLFKMTGGKSKFIRILTIVVMLAALTFPLWEGATDFVMQKQMNNLEIGGYAASRSGKWLNRWIEFKSSPIWGIGFDAIDLNFFSDYSREKGQIEPGTSWMAIPSMLGLIGVLIMAPFFYRCFVACYKGDDSKNALRLGLFILFCIHMLAEGYIFSAGGFLCFILWLTLANCYDQKYTNFDNSVSNKGV